MRGLSTTKRFFAARILLLLFMQFCLTGCADASRHQSLTYEQKMDDFNAMFEILKENYPYFAVNKRQYGYDWTERKNYYEKLVSAVRDDQEFLDCLQEILRELHNGHTNIIPLSEGHDYYNAYLGDRPWSDVMSLLHVAKRYGFSDSMVGDTGLPDDNPEDSDGASQNFRTDIIVEDKVAYVEVKSFDYDSINKDYEALYKFYSSIKDYPNLIIDIRGNSGGSETYFIENIVAPLANRKLSVENYCFVRGGEYCMDFYDNRFGLNNIKQTKTIGQEKLAHFPPEIPENFEHYFICDRTVLPKNPVGFKGRIFLLVDRSVYSSAEAFACFCKYSGFATLVGENTGGDGLGIDPVLFPLPHSGFVLRFSSVLALNPDGTANEEVSTKPDIFIDNPIKDHYKYDKCIKKVLELVNEKLD